MSSCFIFESKSQPGQLHKCWLQDGVWRCTCRAGRKGSARCWHLLLVLKIKDCGSEAEMNDNYHTRANWI